MKRILGKQYFNRDVKRVAEDLLGTYLVEKKGKRIAAFKIIETEAYDGERDRACHASKGRTKRTEVLYGEPGRFYVYLCYGTYYLLNVVSREKGYPAGVLIRGVLTDEGKRIDGPGKVTRLLGIDKTFHGKPAGEVTGLWIEKREEAPGGTKIKKTPRIGIDYAGPFWSRKKWRFVLE